MTQQETYDLGIQIEQLEAGNENSPKAAEQHFARHHAAKDNAGQLTVADDNTSSNSALKLECSSKNDGDEQ